MHIHWNESQDFSNLRKSKKHVIYYLLPKALSKDAINMIDFFPLILILSSIIKHEKYNYHLL